MHLPGKTPLRTTAKPVPSEAPAWTTAVHKASSSAQHSQCGCLLNEMLLAELLYVKRHDQKGSMMQHVPQPRISLSNEFPDRLRVLPSAFSVSVQLARAARTENLPQLSEAPSHAVSCLKRIFARKVEASQSR